MAKGHISIRRDEHTARQIADLRVWWGTPKYPTTQTAVIQAAISAAWEREHARREALDEETEATPGA